MAVPQKDIEGVVRQLVGEVLFPLVAVLKKNDNISEFQISTRIKLPVDTIRNQLYQLHSHNLVTFIRKKDKRKGWYIYYWSLNLERIEYLVVDLKKKELERLRNRVKRETENQFYTSDSRCIRVDFEQAANLGFKCPETGELLYQEDNSRIIQELKEEIAQLEKAVKEEESKKILDLPAQPVEQKKKKQKKKE